MSVPNLTSAQIDKMVGYVQQVFPDWAGFADARFEKDEIAYKQHAVQKARELLPLSELMALIDQGKFDEFITRLVSVAQSGKNMLYNATPKKGDIGVLYQDNLDKPGFCRAFVDLIHGNDPSPERLGQFSAYLSQNNLPNKWTFATYFLYVCHPESEIFVKPQAIKWFFQFVGMPEPLPPQPSAEVYAQLLQLCRQLWDGLQAYQPRDYVHIQSFIWVAYSAATTTEKLAKPFDKMFKDWDQAQWAFDLLRKALELLGVQDADDPRLAVTLRKSNGYRFIRVNYGLWLTIGIYGKDKSITSLHLALLKDKLNLPWLSSGDFIQPPEETPISLYEISLDDFQTHEAEIWEVFSNTIPLIVSRFSGGASSPHHHNNNQQLAEAILEEEARKTLLSYGTSDTGIEEPPPSGVTRYWKIAPGAEAWNWEACRQGGFITMGWDDVGDISGVSQAEFDQLVQAAMERHSDWTLSAVKQLWTFSHIQVGDRIVANHGKKEVLGIGTVTGPYFYVPGIKHAHHLPVRWDDTQRRPVNKEYWVKALFELTQEEFEEILRTPPIGEVNPPDRLFDEQTFQLLEQLHLNPTQDFYNKHKQGFKDRVVEPLQSLMQQTAALLRPEIRALMETEKDLFSRFNKNDYGQGRMYDYYWGAFYVKAGTRTSTPQLLSTINRERFLVGFMFGQYGESYRARFIKNCRENAETLMDWFSELADDPSLGIGVHDRSKNQDLPVERRIMPFDQWL